MFQLEKQAFRVIIIDDDPDWRRMLAGYVSLLGHTSDLADSLEDAKKKIEESERTGATFSVALLDMNFKIGEDKILVPQGRQVIKYIKTYHPYITCIMISGSANVTPDFVLDLRDEFDLDYFLEKQNISEEVLLKAIQKATRRISPIGSTDRHIRVLKDSLDKWKSTLYLCQNNLARAKEREAFKGIDVDATTNNEIDKYQIMCEEAQVQIKKLQEEIGMYD